MGAEELLADVELVWANCRQFNTEASPIDKACTKAQRLLQKLWHRAKLPGSAPAAAAAVASQPAPEAAGPSTGEGAAAHILARVLHACTAISHLTDMMHSSIGCSVNT